MCNPRFRSVVFVRCALLFITIGALGALIAGCGGLGDAIRMSKSMIQGEQNPDRAEPAFYETDFSTGSGLPSYIAFDASAGIDEYSFPYWVSKELGVELKKDTPVVKYEGETHLRYQQYHEGVPVSGAQYILHISENETSCNGKVFGDIPDLGTPKFDIDQVLDSMEREFPNHQFSSLGLSVTPVFTNYAPDFYLTYDLLAAYNESREFLLVSIDAMNFEFRMVRPFGQDISGQGTGIRSDGTEVHFGTEYIDRESYGDANIEIIGMGSGYRLKDTVRNLHTMTFDHLTRIKSFSRLNDRLRFTDLFAPGREILDPDNNFESTPRAVDVHWGMTKTWDYFFNTHNRTGADGNKGYMAAYVNFFRDYNQASYFRYGNYLMFGDGSQPQYKFTELEAVAHEFTHGVTYNIYKPAQFGEPSSIDEGLADIFATCIEFQYDRGNWLFGDEVIPGGMRNLQDPKSLEGPDTYEGDYWKPYRTEFERELELRDRPHDNATILTHWFYLLSEGGEGENDNEDHYDIEPIGREKAADLVYQSMFRMTSSTNFHDLRKITSRTARKLYGRCSDELKAVTNAWYAVGVGDPFCDCFNGSVVIEYRERNKSNKMTYYFEDGKTAVAVTDDKGGTHILNTTPGDPYRHYKGRQDLPPYLANIFQSKTVLFQKEHTFQSRKAYVEYRNRFRTGRTMEVSGYTAYEYTMQGETFWSTDEVCLALVDQYALFSNINRGTKMNNWRTLFGYPVLIRQPDMTIKVLEIREYDVPNSYFTR